jgi:hypothetical protein
MPATPPPARTSARFTAAILAARLPASMIVGVLVLL